MSTRVLLLLVVIAVAAPAGATADPARYMDAKLVAETTTPNPGSTVLVGFRFTPKAGWHGYWSNPGDSGIAPTVRWTAPDGVAFGPLLHPAPTLLSTDGISSFVHDGPHVLLSRMTVAQSIAPGTPIPVNADLRWAACTATQCVPLSATFTLNLVAGEGASIPDASILRVAAAKLPRPAAGATFAVEGNRLRLELPSSLGLDASKTRFFPDESGHFDPAAAHGSVEQGAVVLAATMEGKAPRSLSGVASDGRRSYRLTFAPEPVASSADKPEVAQTEAASQRSLEKAEQRAATPNPAAPVPESEREQRRWPWLVFAAVLAVGAAAFAWRRSGR